MFLSCRRYFFQIHFSLPLQLQATMLSHPPLPCTPPPSILLRAWQKLTLPCLPASTPLKLLPARRTKDREEERQKERELSFSVRDYILPLFTHHTRLPAIRSCWQIEKEWERLQETDRYNLKQMAVLRPIFLLEKPFKQLWGLARRPPNVRSTSSCECWPACGVCSVIQRRPSRCWNWS